MRIPVSKLDLSQGRFTKVARALQKIWALEPLSLMQAQERMASFLGYRNLHDLQVSATPEVTSVLGNKLSRSAICNAVAWKMFRNYSIDLLHAAELASKLHLNRLEVDFFTTEALFEREQVEMKKQGRFLIMDEAWSLLNPPWNPKTPLLIDAHVPAFSYAVLPDRQMFRWSYLEMLLSAMPADFMDDLRADHQYAQLSSDEAREQAFVLRELYPHACRPLAQSIKESQTLPEGFQITWVFSREGQCLGRVLNNKAIGGIIPVVFSVDGDEIFEAAGRMLCGEAIPASLPRGDVSSEPLFKLRFGFGGYDLERDIKNSSGIEEKPIADNLVTLNGSIRFQMIDESPVLSGEVFKERGQVYLRCQKWIQPDQIPEYALSKTEYSAFVAKGLQKTGSEVFPAFDYALHNLVKDQMDSRIKHASISLRSEEGISAMKSLLVELVTPEAFDAYCDTLIDEYLPLRYPEDTEDNESLIDDRQRELERMRWLGNEVKGIVPTLSGFKETTLALILLLANDQYPNSRYASSVYLSKEYKIREIADLFAGMVFFAACCANGLKYDDSMEQGHLALVVHDVLSAKASADHIAQHLKDAQSVMRRLNEQERYLNGVSEWQKHQDKAEAIRAAGEFLAVGTPMGRERPKGMADLFAMARSANVVPIMATQSLSDFTKLTS